MPFRFDPGIFSVGGLAGEVLPGTRLFWYASGTSTPLATYADPDLEVANTNPVLSAADGRLPPIWLQDDDYKLVVGLPDGTIITRDPIRNPGSGVFPSFDELSASDGSDLIGGLILPVASRTVLAAVPPIRYAQAYLSEKGREGTFSFKMPSQYLAETGRSLTADVALDTRQGIIVAAASDPTGGAGAWVRSTDQDYAIPEWFGVTGANDEVAINAALAMRKTVLLSRRYVVGSTGSVIRAQQVGNKLIGYGSAEIFTTATPNAIANIYIVDLDKDFCKVDRIAFSGVSSTVAGTAYPVSIRVFEADACAVTNCTFNGISWGVWVTSTDASSKQPKGTQVKNNTFYDMTGPVADKGGYGILSTYNDGIDISGNHFLGTSRHCIYISDNSRNFSVSGNDCRGSRLSPLAFNSGTIPGHYVGPGKAFGNQLLCGGTPDPDSHGITMTGAMRDIDIDENFVDGALAYGLFAQAAGAGAFQPTRVRFRNNVVSNSQLWGVSCVDGVGIQFLNNTFRLNNRSGLGASEVVISKSVAATSGSHILKGNVIVSDGLSTNGIRIGAGCDNCRLDGNEVSGTAGTPISDSSSTAQIKYANYGNQTVAYAAVITIDPTLGEVVEVTLTGNTTLAVDALKKAKGQRLILRMKQDATGGRTVGLSSVFKHKWSDTGNTANMVQSAEFICLDGIFFSQVSAVSGYYAA